MRKYLSAVGAIALAIAVTGCGSSKEQVGNTASNGGSGSSKSYHELRWGAVSAPAALDFTRSPWPQGSMIEALTVNNLMEFEPDGKVKTGVASSVEQPDSTTYIYHLRHIKFSNGRPLTAADVVYSLYRNVHSSEAWTKTYWEDVASITARNGSTVEVKLKHPRATFQRIVAFSGQVVEKAAAEKSSEKELGTPGHLLVGTGPWKLDSYKTEASAHLSRNPYWTGPAQPAEKITVSLFKTEASLALALRSGAVEGTFDYFTPKTFTNIPGMRQLIAPSSSIDFVSANTARPPFNDVHVRRALAYASDARGMISAIYPAGVGTLDQTIMPASLFAGLGSASEVSKVLSALPTYNFSLADARRELAKSAYPHGFTTTIEVEQAVTSLVSSAEIFASDLAKIGITAKVEELSGSNWELEINGKTPLVVNETTAVYPDPEAVMSFMLVPSQIHPPGSGLNSANFRNAEFDKLIPASVESLDPPKRLQLIGKMMKIVADEAPYWPLYSHATLASVSTKYVLPTFSSWTWLFTPWALHLKLAS